MPDLTLPAEVLRTAARAVLRRTAARHVKPPGDRVDEDWSCSRLNLPAPSAQLSSDVFRGVMAAFPSAVTVVTSRDRDGDPRGLTCSAMASVSVDPPLVAVCVNRRNGSLAAIRDSGGFALNLLRRRSSHVSDIFASPSPAKFQSVTWRPSRVTGLPWLVRDSAALLDCRLAADIEIATHAVLFGLVVDSEVGQPEEAPLLYWRRSYGGWSGAEAAAPSPTPVPAPARPGTGVRIRPQ